MDASPLTRHSETSLSENDDFYDRDWSVLTAYEWVANRKYHCLIIYDCPEQDLFCLIHSADRQRTRNRFYASAPKAFAGLHKWLRELLSTPST